MVKKKLLISKKFKNISEVSECIEYIEDLNMNDIDVENYVLGQGSYFFLKNLPVEDKKYVHKQYSKNVIITKPMQQHSNTFGSQLILHPRTAEIQDHLTGYHIPAMVIIEASRQMMISVIERFYNQCESIGRYYFIINNMETKFNNFLFPWDIKLTFTINSIIKLKNCIKYESTTVFKQNDIICSQILINFSVFFKNDLLKLEKRSAQASLGKYRDNYNKFEI